MSVLQRHDGFRVISLWVPHVDAAYRAAEEFAEVRGADNLENLALARAVNLAYLMPDHRFSVARARRVRCCYDRRCPVCAMNLC